MKELSTFTNELIAAQPLIYSYVVSCLPGYPGQVRDVVQRVNEALVRREAAFDSSRPFVPWAIGFAKQQVRAFLDEQRRGRVLYDSDYIDGITDSYAAPQAERSRYRTDDLERLEICKSRLREQQRKLLDLRYDRELTIEEIARLTDNKAENVKSNLSYLRARLAECIRKLCDLSRDNSSSLPPMNRVQSLTSDLLDGGHLSAKETQNLRHLLADSASRESYLDELEVHALLAWSGRPPQPVVAAAPVSDVPRTYWLGGLAAAGVALLVGGLVWMHEASGGRSAEAAARSKAPTVESSDPTESSAEEPHQAEEGHSRLVQVPPERVAPPPPPAAVAAAEPPVVAAPSVVAPPAPAVTLQKPDEKRLAVVARPAVTVRPATASAAMPAAGITKEKETMKIKTAAVSVAAVTAAFVTTVPADDAAHVFDADTAFILDTRPHDEVQVKTRNGYLDTRSYDCSECSILPFDTKTPTGTIYSFK